MSHDRIFRDVLIILLLLATPVGIYYRLRSLTNEKLDRRQEGLFILATLRPVGAVLWIGLIAWMVEPKWMAWSSASLPDWLRWTGIGILAIACGMLLWTMHSLGKNLTDTVVTRENHALVTYGPYRWIRHPFYDSAALLATALFLAISNWFFLVVGCVFFCLVVIRTRKEEENLLARFGDSYRSYMQETGRFLPRVGRIRS